MITDYETDNEKVIFLDTKKGTIEHDYQDNIQDIIAIKNVIEVLENNIKEIKKNIGGYKIYKKIGYGLLIALALLNLWWISCLIIPIFMEGSIISIIIGSFISLVTILGDSLFGYNTLKIVIPKTNNRININIETFNKLESELQNQKNKLNVLESLKTKNRKELYNNKKENKQQFISLMNQELKNMRKILEEYKQEINKNQDYEDKVIDESLVLNLTKKIMYDE